MTVQTIPSFFQYHPLLASGAQPTAEQIDFLKKEGFEVVVNISTASAKNAIAGEAKTVESNGMQYVHFTVDCSDLQNYHYEVFRGILKGLEGKKVFVHCGANIKSSCLIHMYQVLEKGMNEMISWMELTKIHSPEEKWIQYFQKAGMKGIQEFKN